MPIATNIPHSTFTASYVCECWCSVWCNVALSSIKMKKYFGYSFKIHERKCQQSIFFRVEMFNDGHNSIMAFSLRCWRTHSHSIFSCYRIQRLRSHRLLDRCVCVCALVCAWFCSHFYLAMGYTSQMGS